MEFFPRDVKQCLPSYWCFCVIFFEKIVSHGEIAQNLISRPPPGWLFFSAIIRRFWLWELREKKQSFTMYTNVLDTNEIIGAIRLNAFEINFWLNSITLILSFPSFLARMLHQKAVSRERKNIETRKGCLIIWWYLRENNVFIRLRVSSRSCEIA